MDWFGTTARWGLALAALTVAAVVAATAVVRAGTSTPDPIDVAGAPAAATPVGEVREVPGASAVAVGGTGAGSDPVRASPGTTGPAGAAADGTGTTDGSAAGGGSTAGATGGATASGTIGVGGTDVTVTVPPLGTDPLPGGAPTSPSTTIVPLLSLPGLDLAGLTLPGVSLEIPLPAPPTSTTIPPWLPDW